MACSATKEATKPHLKLTSIQAHPERGHPKRAQPDKAQLDKEQPERARPVLKWAGGKSSLLKQYAPFFPGNFNAYFEPFVGGGAVFFYLNPDPEAMRIIRLSDVNEELINLYRVLRDHPQKLIDILGQHQKQHNKEYYYQIRSQHPSRLTPEERAARLLYLNKTCYNGLYRVNSKGHFNVPFGRYKKPAILSETRLWAASRALQKVELATDSFEHILSYAQKGDFVYFDPPYHPLSSTSNFTSYSKDNFDEDDQSRLAEVFKELTRRGVKVMLSNSATPLIKTLYAGFKIIEIKANRFINSKADGRRKITELLILNY